MKEERELSQFIDAFDLFDCIERITKHKHIGNLKGLRKVIDNRIEQLENSSNGSKDVKRGGFDKMAYVIRTARKDFTSTFGVEVKKGQRYLDKGFGSISLIDDVKEKDVK